jgi:hypothetical protein
MVWPGTRQPIEDRSVVFLAGQAPPDLPSPYERNVPNRPSEMASQRKAQPRLRLAPDWPVARIRAGLDAFLEGRDRWPSFPEFQEAGLALLHEQMRRHAHPRRWAHVTGLPYLIATPDGRPWSDERIRSELAAFLAGRREWPTYADFKAAGHANLRIAVTAFGGPERWAGEMGVELSARRRGREYQWTYPRMRRELARLTEGRTDWPRQAEFKAAGLLGLYRITGRRHLRQRLARELGLTPPVERKPRTPSWTDEEIRSALDDFLKGRANWPTTTEFRRAGLGSLIRRITSCGQRDRWARHYNLDPPTPPKRWTDHEIKAALDTFLEGRHEWPTWSEFQQAGLVGLISNLGRAGTQQAWAERYGLASRR